MSKDRGAPTPYATDNDETTRMLFQQRTRYRSKVSKDFGSARNVNFMAAERMLYGRVNTSLVPINLRKPKTTALATGLKPYGALGASPTRTLVGVDFVVDRFRAMAAIWDNNIRAGVLGSGNPFLSGPLRAHRAAIQPRRLYSDYRKAVVGQFASSMKEHEGVDRITNFDEFLDTTLDYFKDLLCKVPFTQSAYIKSRHCTPMVTGLSVEVASLDPANDVQKRKFMSGLEWPFFISLCNANGFMIDANIPWRITADLAGMTSAGLLDTSYGMVSPYQILGTYYVPSHHQFYPQFRKILLDMYKRSCTRTYVETEYCSQSGTAIVHKKHAQVYSLETLEEEYQEEDFLRYYCKLRFMEEESTFTEAEQRYLIEKVIELYESSDRSETMPAALGALDVFERILNKTFDYIGSIAYIKTVVTSLRRGR